ncbi:aminotransferase class V-fold PLP-dependent enzyme [Dongia soli]|uniref:Aminotransferase class V-fold PLP-dependent enzyme n=1 Tax=Dongia soli TaxID=600628 RepID=A0ABU5ECY6_9PROT|nr:aminotransferase class V-fold PLP-dependent enzyme [Dongia soli]MDY0884204.1 aminotransferase class V-fold PLP-dependent enzyme [Dongia soli]
MMVKAVLDTAFVRAQFAPLADGWVFVENAGGTYVPRQVVDRVQEYMSQTQVQPNWGFASSERATERIRHGKQLMAEFINAEPDEIVFGPSTTMNVYLLAQAIRPWLKQGDEIIVTEQDHEANVGAWRRLAEFGVVIKEWQVDRATGALRYEMLDELLSDKTRLVAFTHCSNVCSIVHDAAALVRKIHDAGALAFIDGTAYAPHFSVDVKALDVDFYVCSLYKFCGPHQSILYGKRDLLRKAANQNHHFITDDNISYKLLPGGPNHEFAAGAVGVADYYDALHDHHFKTRENNFHARLTKVYGLIAAHEERLAARLTAYLNTVPGIQIIGRVPSSDGRLAPVIGFRVAGRSSAEIVRELNKRQIAIGHGDFWAARVIKAMGMTAEEGVIRIGFAHYNDDADADRLIAALKEVL